MKSHKYGIYIYQVACGRTIYIDALYINSKEKLRYIQNIQNNILYKQKISYIIYNDIKNLKCFKEWYNKKANDYITYCENNKLSTDASLETIEHYLDFFSKNYQILEYIPVELDSTIQQRLDYWVIKQKSYIYGLNKRPESLDIIDNNINGDYKVYKHTSPTGKVYIGITGQNSVKDRWKNGLGYKKNYYFYHDIKKYGWDNFTHEVLEEDLTLEKAWDREVYYIDKYNSYFQGYNQTRGGNFYPNM